MNLVTRTRNCMKRVKRAQTTGGASHRDSPKLTRKRSVTRGDRSSGKKVTRSRTVEFTDTSGDSNSYSDTSSLDSGPSIKSGDSSFSLKDICGQVKGHLIGTFETKTKFDTQDCVPAGITFDLAGDLVVSDSANRKIKAFTLDGSLKAEYCIPGSYSEQLIEPCGVAILQSGNLIVTDRGAGNVKIFTDEGRYLCTFGNDLLRPSGVTLAPQKGKVIVADQESKKINIYENHTAAAAVCIPKKGQQELFKYPTGVAFVGLYLVVCDPIRNCLILLDENGNAVQQYPSSATKEFGKIANIVADAEGTLLVLDNEKGRVVRMRIDAGQLMAKDILSLSEVLHNPESIAINQYGNLVIAEKNSAIVKIFQLSS